MSAHSEQNQRIEEEILNKYLLFHSEFKNAHPYKTEKPDFTLECNKGKHGIEVTRLIAPRDAILMRITEEAYKQHYNAEQAKAWALDEHGRKAGCYTFHDLSGRLAIYSGMMNLMERREHFARKIWGKIAQYEKRGDFDSITILCDARACIDITDRNDADDLKEDIAECQGVDEAQCDIYVALLYNDNDEQKLSCYEWLAIPRQNKAKNVEGE